MHSLQSYFFNDDTFNFNYAQAKAATGNFQEAEEVSQRNVHTLLGHLCNITDIPADNLRQDQE